MKIINNYLLSILVVFCYFLLFDSAGNALENLNIKEAEKQETTRRSRMLLGNKPIKNDSSFLASKTEELNLESIDTRHFPVRLRTYNNSHLDDNFDFNTPQNIVIEYRIEF